MRTPTRVLLGLGAATIVAAGGTAFTESNNLTAVDNEYLGYGSATVTGVSISNIEYNLDAVDATKLDNVVFLTGTATNLSTSTYEAVLTITNVDNTVSRKANCAGIVYDSVSTRTTITCSAATHAVANVKGIALTVNAI